MTLAQCLSQETTFMAINASTGGVGGGGRLESRLRAISVTWEPLRNLEITPPPGCASRGAFAEDK